MDLFLFHDADYQRLYNCTFYNVEQIPLAERQHLVAGLIFVIIYVLLFVLYAVCVFIMITTELRRNTSYKLMINLGLIHLVGLQTSGLFVGAMAIQGAVFCSNPTLHYFVGGTAVSTWCASTLANLILAINRCCELYDPKFARLIFQYPRLCLWLAAPHLYMLFVFFYTKPSVFSAYRPAFLFNPHVGYFEDYGDVYHNPAHHANNIVVSISELFIYVLLVCAYRRAINVATLDVRNKLRSEKRLYIQIVLIGLIHLFTGMFYLIIQFFPTTLPITLMASALYFLSQGFPSVIYLTINHTIRRQIIRRIAAPRPPGRISVSLYLNSPKPTITIGG